MCTETIGDSDVDETGAGADVDLRGLFAGGGHSLNEDVGRARDGVPGFAVSGGARC